MPRFSYKRVRGEGPQPDPVHVRNGRAYQSQEQITEHLLCANCEARFQRVETRIADLLPVRDGRPAPILSRLGNVLETTPEGTRFVELGKVKGSDLAYFAASVPAFPESAAFIAEFFDLPFNDSVDLKATVVGIQSYRRQGRQSARAHGFMIMGLRFFLQIGAQLEDWATSVCVVRQNQMLLSRQERLVGWLAPAMFRARVDSRLAGRLRR